MLIDWGNAVPLANIYNIGGKSGNVIIPVQSIQPGHLYFHESIHPTRVSGVDRDYQLRLYRGDEYIVLFQGTSALTGGVKWQPFYATYDLKVKLVLLSAAVADQHIFYLWGRDFPPKKPETPPVLL